MTIEQTLEAPEETVRPADLPRVEGPKAPPAGRIWSRALVLVAIALALWLLDRLAVLLMDFWLLESLGYERVFWTNFRMGALLFVVALLLVTVAIALPAFVLRLSRSGRRRAVFIAILAGVVAGYAASLRYLEFLMLTKGKAFGETDPVFDFDLGFYVFKLPAITTMINFALVVLGLLLVSSLVCGSAVRRTLTVPAAMPRLTARIGAAFNPLAVTALILFGVAIAVRTWIERYDVVLRSNTDSYVHRGAEFIDVTGFFSTVNGFTVSALAILFGIGGLALRLRALHRSTVSPTDDTWVRLGVVSLLFTLLPGAAIDSSFRAMLALRNETQVTPNEPVVQLPYIKRHVDATQKGFDLDKVERIDFTPRGPDDPPPNIDDLLNSSAVKNAPLWPGFVSWFEPQVDPEYVPRLLETDGEEAIYAPSLDVFRAQQKLRPYYDFMDIDTVRYTIDGQKRMMASGVRELPKGAPQPWLLAWGQRLLLYTHGYGLVAAPVEAATQQGEPDFASHSLPPTADTPSLLPGNHAVYYGEGSGGPAFTNANNIREHDFPTDQGRAEVEFPDDVRAGVRLDSVVKRLVFGYKSDQFFDVAFSDLFDSDSRVHYFRTPMERVREIAPFIYADSDPYAVPTDDGITWMINGMTHTDRYPFSALADLGDKSVRRSPTPAPFVRANYVKDSVKMTLDAYTGQLNLYKWADEPIVNTWEGIYPTLFRDRDEMPAVLQEQVQYPTQLFHVQFDDLYWYYHMEDPLDFFSFEDAFDDADEVKGAISYEGEAITFSMEPYFWLADTGGAMPATKDPQQFSMSMAFTPEAALNLRAITTAYQEGEDYGKLHVLQVPKGQFVPGPEQADAATDQDSFISQQFTLWTRLGLEVIRGHTVPLVIDREVIYIEPIFIRSKQNPIPQMKRVVAVYRGNAAMGRTLEEALRSAVSGIEAGDLDFDPEAAEAAAAGAESGGGPPAAPGGPPGGRGGRP